MSEELRTLKDFEVNPKSWASAMVNAGRKYTIGIPELRQEAIKWVKELKILNSFCLNCLDSMYSDKCKCYELWKNDYGTFVERPPERTFFWGEIDGDDCENPQLINFLKVFFNLSEADLK